MSPPPVAFDIGALRGAGKHHSKDGGIDDRAGGQEDASSDSGESSGANMAAASFLSVRADASMMCVAVVVVHVFCDLLGLWVFLLHSLVTDIPSTWLRRIQSSLLAHRRAPSVAICV